MIKPTNYSRQLEQSIVKGRATKRTLELFHEALSKNPHGRLKLERTDDSVRAVYLRSWPGIVAGLESMYYQALLYHCEAVLHSRPDEDTITLTIISWS